MNDAERDDLLRRLAEAERARRRWKVLALLGTPVLGVLLVMAVSFGTSSYLMLREAIKREKNVGDAIWVDLSLDGQVHTVHLLNEAEVSAEMPRVPEP
jgi:uncharacterized protein YuzE